MRAPRQPTITFVVPTSGRKSLGRTLHSITSQFAAGDEIILVYTDYGDGGNTGRNSAQNRAEGDWIAFMDDDDVFVAGAIEKMRAWAAANPQKIAIFRRKSDAWPTQWSQPVLVPGNVAPPLFLVPNVRGSLAEWGQIAHKSERRAVELEQLGLNPYDWSDSWFVSETAALQGAEIVFVDLVTSYAQPQPWWRRARNRLRVGRRLAALTGRLKRTAA
jgi:glycosyltransferase involved in cell wall biosynthesis